MIMDEMKFGKIIKGIAGFYYVHDGYSKLYECKAKGIFRNRKLKPLVGDNVKISILNEQEMEGNIDEILPRKNEIIRPNVSNIDQAMVVFSVTHPEPNLNLLDRYLVMMETQKIEVSICFNKIDLADEEKTNILKEIYESIGYQVFFISAKSKKGIDEIRTYFRGKTTVLAGPSGVGKSTLTNQLYPEANMETGDISRKIERGKHTTRHAQIFWMEECTYFIDTPGFSSIQIDLEDERDLKYYFPEFVSKEEDCKFLGCNHLAEPVCGVKVALNKGEISATRYENYKLIYQEIKDKRRY